MYKDTYSFSFHSSLWFFPFRFFRSHVHFHFFYICGMRCSSSNNIRNPAHLQYRNVKNVVFHCLSSVRKSLLLALAVHVIPSIFYLFISYSFFFSLSLSHSLFRNDISVCVSFPICFWFYVNQRYFRRFNRLFVCYLALSTSFSLLPRSLAFLSFIQTEYFTHVSLAFECVSFRWNSEKYFRSSAVCLGKKKKLENRNGRKMRVKRTNEELLRRIVENHINQK